MPQNSADAGRLRKILAPRRAITEKPMFGGICFLLRRNMLCVWSPRGFLFRVGPEQEGKALARPGAKPMVMAGRRMRGYVRVDPRVCNARALERWTAMAERFVSALPPKERKK
jgi:TfoX/Sxy family transcriptional regulator of competence genes